MSFLIVNNGITTKYNLRFDLAKTFNHTLELLIFKKKLNRYFHTRTPKSADAELNIAPRLAVAKQIINASGQLGR
jgi:hypothetical protein